MALTFLNLVNDVLKRLNEVPLTSGNFNSATGVYADAKNYVNSAINRINREEFEWPFNHVKFAETLIPEQAIYNYQTDAKSVAFDTFVLQGDEALNVESKRLQILDYEQYLQEFPEFETSSTEYKTIPDFVVRNRNLSYTLAPPPDKAYTVNYEYYKLPEDLVDWDDTTTIPDIFRWVILEGALYPAYTFRGALEEATLAEKTFLKGVEDMRKMYINRYEYVRSGQIRR